MTEEEFRRYFEGTSLGSAIVFETILPFINGPTLKHLRSQLGSFQPPQFFKRLSPSGPELAFLRAAHISAKPIKKWCLSESRVTDEFTRNPLDDLAKQLQ
jgi:hypothetical protein